jgi:hypothetical protein
MFVISLGQRCPRIKITNEKTYEEVLIECRDYDEEQKLLIDIVANILNREE